MRLEDFDYHLPPELVVQYRASVRGKQPPQTVNQYDQ